MSEIYNRGCNILENFDILPMFSAQVKLSLVIKVVSTTFLTNCGTILELDLSELAGFRNFYSKFTKGKLYETSESYGKYYFAAFF